MLDEALIPPQGAPVQCTRCGHVFTAKPGAPDVAPPPQAIPPWENPELQNKPASSTLVFGGASAPKSAPSASQTMVFGSPAVGAGSAPAPAPVRGNKNETMVFGTPGVGVGSAPAHPPAAAPKANQTMVFGTPAANVAPPPAQAAASAKQTMVFGGTPPVQAPPPAAPKANQTMVFGTPAANAARPPPAAPAAQNPSQTLVFGGTRPAAATTPAHPAAAPPAAAAPAKNQTMMFGRTPPAKPIPKVTVGSAEPAGYAANEEEGQRTESTVRVELDTVDDPPAEESIEARHDRTQRYAMTDGAAGPSGEEPPAGSVEERHNRTVLFAMNPMQETTKPDGNLPPPSGKTGGEPAVNQTLVFGARPNSAAITAPVNAVMATPPDGSPPAEPVATTLPNLPSYSSSPSGLSSPSGISSMPLDLPPEPSFGPTPDVTTDSGLANDDVAAMRSASNRRTTIAVVVFLVIALGLALTLVWYVFGRAIVSKESVEIRTETAKALATLRQDDLASQRKVIGDLRTLLSKYPDSLDAQSALVVALAVSADDARADVLREQRLAKRLEERVADTPPENAEQARANAAAQNETVRAKQTIAERLTAEMVAARTKLVALQQPSLSAAEQFALARADALAASILAEGNEALMLAERARQVSVGLTDKQPDNWSDLVVPEYVINSGTGGCTDSCDDALRQLQIIQTRDSTFLRAHVLAARIHLKQNQIALADEDLTRVLSLSPSHDSAKQLQAMIAAERR